MLLNNKMVYMSPRPIKERKLATNIVYTCFKPAGISRKFLEKVELKADEIEALKLANIDWLTNLQAAEKMNISAPTFNRILKSAYRKITDALINGKWIRIYKIDGSSDC